MPRNDGYDKPRTPAATPPVIDPEVDPKAAAELEEGSAQEGNAKGARSESGKANRELNERIRKRQEKDGAGEQELDSMTPDTLLPPD